MEKYVFPFEKLEVWQLAVDLAEFVLGLLAYPLINICDLSGRWKLRYCRWDRILLKEKVGSTRKSSFSIYTYHKALYMNFSRWLRYFEEDVF